MAREVIELPAGVSQVEFDAHKHDYRKLTQVGADSDVDFGSPIKADVVDDAEVNVGETPAVRAIGVTVATLPTGTPV